MQTAIPVDIIDSTPQQSGAQRRARLRFSCLGCRGGRLARMLRVIRSRLLVRSGALRLARSPRPAATLPRPPRRFSLAAVLVGASPRFARFRSRRSPRRRSRRDGLVLHERQVRGRDPPGRGGRVRALGAREEPIHRDAIDVGASGAIGSARSEAMRRRGLPRARTGEAGAGGSLRGAEIARGEVRRSAPAAAT